MCMFDNSDGVTMLSTADPVARKQHKCAECRRVIRAGEKYHIDRFVFDGSMAAHKVCAHCIVVREWLSAECGGWVFGEIEEDIREHANDGYPASIARLAVGMKWMWEAPSGRMLPVPTRPKTSIELRDAA